MEEYPLYLGLGSNIGDRKGNIIEALARLDKALGYHYDAVSDLVETDPWGFEADEKFMNAVVRYIMPVPRGTSEYKNTYKNRTSCERVNDRVLNDYQLHNMKIHTKKRYSFFLWLIGTNIHLDARLKKLRLQTAA